MVKGFYVQELKKSWLLILVGFILAVFCVWIFYPGIFYSDSYRRVDFAYTLVNHDMSGRRMWLTPTPSYFMALSILLTGDIGLYSFGQAFLYFVLSMFMIKSISRCYRGLQYILFALNPALFAVSIYYEAGVGCLTGIWLMLLVVFSAGKLCTQFDRIFAACCMLVGSFLTFGYRSNALTILPVIAVGIWLAFKEKKSRLIIEGMLIAGFLLVGMIPKMLGIDTMSSVATSFVWETLSTIQGVEYDKQQQYYSFLDEIAGPGTTYDALTENTDARVGGWLWGDGLNYESLSQEGVFPVVLKKYCEIATEQPKAFLKNKLHSIRYSLGAGNPLVVDEWKYNLNGRMEELHFHDGRSRMFFYELYLRAVKIQLIWQRPWILFGMSMILVPTYLKMSTDKNQKRNKVLLFTTAIFYYGAFFINTQSYEVRYFFPSACMLLLLDIATLCELINVIKCKRKRF